MSKQPLQRFHFVPFLLLNRLRDTHLKPLHLDLHDIPVGKLPVKVLMWKCTSHGDRHLLFSHQKVLQILSRMSTRQNSAPFRAGDFSVSTPLQRGIRFLRRLALATPSACLAVGFAIKQHGDVTSLPRSAINTVNRLRSTPYTGGATSASGARYKLPTWPLTIWSKPASLFGLLLFTILQVFAYADLIDQS